MTNNKMPKVGERYRNKNVDKAGKLTALFLDQKYPCAKFVFDNGEINDSVLISSFWDHFEPILQGPISQSSIPVKEEQKIKCLCKFTKQIGSGSCIACTEYNKWVQDSCVTTVSSDPSVKEGRLLEVGKSYFNLAKKVDFEVLEIKDGGVKTRIKEYPIYPLPEFWDFFEEIPNNSQKLSEVQVKESILSDEVREAMEKVSKEIIKEKYGEWIYHFQELRNASQKLLNALESLDESNIPEKGDCGIVKDAKHPIQPVILDDNGVARFKENKIVSYLLDKTTKAKICDSNEIAILVAQGAFNEEDRAQLTQLIGYSVGGAGDLSYMPKAIIEEADRQVENLINNNQVEEDCELEQAADEWNTEIVEEEKKSEEKNVIHIKALNLKPEDMTMKVAPCVKCGNPSGEISIHLCEREKPKSIWKDVSELPKNTVTCLISSEGEVCVSTFNQGMEGFILPTPTFEGVLMADKVYPSKYCELSDFINDCESEKQKRIELEQRINKLENK